MSWICKNCETENPDALDICEVCETHAPKVVDFSYGKVLTGKPIEIRWKTEHCDQVSIYYKGETINVTDKNFYCIENPEEREISFLLSNSDTTTRTESFVLNFTEHPIICFSSNKNKLRKGHKEIAEITWDIKNANRAYLICGKDKTKVALTGKQEVSPEVTTNYMLEVLALDDETSFTEEIQIGVFVECTIDFKADKYYVFPSIPVVLSWKVDNGRNLMLDDESVESEGTKIVEPEEATSYVLTAEDEFGKKEKRIDIQMLPIPQVKTLLVPTPEIENNLSVSIQQPRYNVDVKFPKVDIDWIKAEVPRVKSLTELGLFKELIPPLTTTRFSLWRAIKRVYNHLTKK